jgi:hypothetical protein
VSKITNTRNPIQYIAIYTSQITGVILIYRNRSQAEVLFNFVNNHSVAVLSSVIANLNDGETHKAIAHRINMDPGQFSRFLITCLSRTYCVKPELSAIIDIFTEQMKRNAESAKGSPARIYQLGERGTVNH